MGTEEQSQDHCPVVGFWIKLPFEWTEKQSLIGQLHVPDIGVGDGVPVGVEVGGELQQQIPGGLNIGNTGTCPLGQLPEPPVGKKTVPPQIDKQFGVGAGVGVIVGVPVGVVVLVGVLGQQQPGTEEGLVVLGQLAVAGGEQLGIVLVPALPLHAFEQLGKEQYRVRKPLVLHPYVMD